jgi:UDP-2,3-diacylglucosamine hydrolase
LLPVPPSRVVVVADAHLGQVPAAVATAFHRFLDAVPDLGDALLINGDVFDFWYEYKTAVFQKHFATLAKLHALAATGLPITFIGGNHDRWGGEFLRRGVGLGYHRSSVELELAGRRALVAHGDGLSEQHWMAALTHRLLQHPATAAVFGAIHPTIGSWIADKLSGTLADRTRDPAMVARVARAQAEYAGTLLRRRPDLQIVVLAHTHMPALETGADGRVYLNPGAFLDGGRYAVVTREEVEMKRFGD